MARKSNKDEYGTTYADTQYNYKGVECDLVQDDVGAVLNMAIKGIKSYGGRPPVYPPTKDGLEQFKEQTIAYLEHVKSVNLDETMEKKVVCDIEGWCVFCGITRMTLSTYYKQRGTDWKTFIDYVKEIIAMTKKQNAMTYRTPPMIAVFDLVNNHSYHNSNEFHITAEQVDNNKIGMKNISQQLEDSGLVWNEETGEFESVED